MRSSLSFLVAILEDKDIIIYVIIIITLNEKQKLKELIYPKRRNQFGKICKFNIHIIVLQIIII